MRSNGKLYSDPVTYPRHPKASDMHKTWYVHFRFLNTTTGKWLFVKKKPGINEIKIFKERLTEIHRLRDTIQDGLDNGWNPITKAFEAEEAEDPLQEIDNLSDMTLAEAVKFGLSKCEVSPRTASNYRNSVNRIIKAARSVQLPNSKRVYDFAEIEIVAIKRKHIRLLLDHCKRTLKWSNKAYNKHMGYLKSVLTRLSDYEVIQGNPALGIKYLPVSETRKFLPYTDKEREQIRDHLFLHHHGFFVIWAMIYDAGMRPNEVLALRPADVNLEKRFIHLIPDRQRDNSKTKNIRTIPLSDTLFALLREWMKDPVDANYYLFGSPYQSGKGLRGSGAGGVRGVMHPDFFRPSPVRIKRDTLTKFWKKVVIDGLKINKHLYAAKHSGADAKILAGISLEALQSLYGHTSKFMTMRYISELKEIYAREIIAKTPGF